MLTRFKPVLPVAICTCLAMVALSELFFLGFIVWRRVDVDDEVPLAILALGLMVAVWSAVIIATVFYPVMRALDAARVALGRPWLYALAGVAAFPLAVAMFALVSEVFPGNGRTFTEQLGFMLRDPSRFASLYLGFVVGGIVFGLGYGARAGGCAQTGPVRQARLGRL